METIVVDYDKATGVWTADVYNEDGVSLLLRPKASLRSAAHALLNLIIEYKHILGINLELPDRLNP